LESLYIFNTVGDRIGYLTSQLVQGARLAGIEVATNVESMQCDGRFCTADLRSAGLTYKSQPGNQDTVIIDETRLITKLEDLGESGFKYYESISNNWKTGLIYSHDDANFIEFPGSYPSFVPHQLHGFGKGNDRVVPVPFGFTLEGFDFAKRMRGRAREPLSILSNFNSSYHQSVREALIAALEGYVNETFKVVSKPAFDDDYAQQLAHTQYAFAFGGAFHWPKTDFSYFKDRLSPRDQKIDQFPGRTRLVGVTRWDSFRFWETMAFGCLPIQLDFEKYGFKLSQNPRKWEHYIPLDLLDMKETFERLVELSLDQPKRLSEMSSEAAEWALSFAHPSELFSFVRDQIESPLKTVHHAI